MVLADDDLFSFDSVVQGRTIDLKDFATFVNQIIPADFNMADYEIVYQHKSFTEKVARGFNIWDRSNPETKSTRLDVLRRYGGVFSNNQGVERANKDQNLAASNQRQEANASFRMTAMSWIKEMCR